MLKVKQLQLAIDTTSIADALRIAEQVYPYYDIAEIGTMLLLEEGMRALEALRSRYPDKKYLADTKIADAGYIEAAGAFKRGADIVTALAVADNITLAGVVKAATQYEGRVMADMLYVPDQAARARELVQLGVDMICLHTAYDLKGPGTDPLAELVPVRRAVMCPIAVAGGLTAERAREALEKGADILVVGAGITRAENPSEAARNIMKIISQV